MGALILKNSLVSSRDIHREVACYRDRLRINCGDHSFIAIHEAFFTTQLQDKSACGPPPIEHEEPPPLPPHLTTAGRSPAIEHEGFLPSPLPPHLGVEGDETTTFTDPTDVTDCYEDIRVSINRRCSGSGSCEYSYADLPDKKCPNLRGEFVVRYDCVRNSSLNKFCNTKLQNPEGYFSSPSYPKFYPPVSECGWTVSSSPGQTILMKVLHLHLRPPTEVVPTVSDPDLFNPYMGHIVEEEDRVCESDALTILESGHRVASLCGESTSGLRTFELDSGQVEVTFKSTAFVPANGFLIYYKVQGCPTPSSPDGSSHLVEGSNNSAAVFACTKPGRIFNDTLEPERILSCVRDHHWNDTLPSCVVLETMGTESSGPEHMAYENGTLPTAERTTAHVKEAAYLEDIIIPSALIGILVVVNAVIVAIILIIRRRNKGKLTIEDETFEDTKTEPLVADIKDL